MQKMLKQKTVNPDIQEIMQRDTYMFNISNKKCIDVVDLPDLTKMKIKTLDDIREVKLGIKNDSSSEYARKIQDESNFHIGDFKETKGISINYTSVIGISIYSQKFNLSGIAFFPTQYNILD